jgi:hypothetical protein
LPIHHHALVGHSYDLLTVAHQFDVLFQAVGVNEADHVRVLQLSKQLHLTKRGHVYALFVAAPGLGVPLSSPRLAFEWHQYKARPSKTQRVANDNKTASMTTKRMPAGITTLSNITTLPDIATLPAR